MKGILRIAFCVLIFSNPIIVYGQSHLSAVWAVDDGEKVRQNDLSHWAKSSPKNEVWNGSRISLFGAKNEIVAFQVILEAATSTAGDVTVALDSLVNGGSVITNTGNTADPTDYVGKRIEMFVEHYTNVTQRSPFTAGYGLPNSRPLPDADYLGPIPDALVPFEAPVKSPAHGQGGAPFSIAAGLNQGVWVDVYIPKDAQAGTYAGVVRIVEGGATTSRIPVSLKVNNITLPDESHQRNFFAWSQELLENRFGLTYNTPEYWAMYRKFMNMAHRHRMSLVDGRESLANFDAHLGEYYTGAAYTTHNGYEGPGMGTGERTYSIGTYDQPNSGFVSGFYPNTQAAWQSAADSWETWFQNHAPQTLRFKYMDDEGDVNNPDVVQAIKDKCTWIKSSPGPGKNLHRFFTKEFVYKGFYDYIDIWSLSAQPGLLLSDIKTRRPSGDMFSGYNGTRPMWGNMELIDVNATDNRVDPWICWKYGVDVIFYWTIAFYAEYVPPSPNAKNVWDDNYLPSGNPYGSIKSWGAGMYMYPGIDVLYPDDSRGVQGPVSCIRMKNFRRGQQDYEYLWLAKQAGIDVSGIVNQVVPHALDDWGDSYTSAASFNQQPAYAQQGYLYEDARRAVAQLLDGESAGATPTATIAATPEILSAGGGQVTVTWNADGASVVHIDNGIGNVSASGTRTVQVSSTTTFTLTAAAGPDSIRASTTVNVEAGELDTANVVANASFETGTDPWIAYSNAQATFDANAAGRDGGLAGHVAIVQSGSNEQLYQYNLVLKPNTQYVLAFAAYSSSGRSMDVSLCEHVAPYTNYGLASNPVALQSSWKDYAINFTTKNFLTTVNDGRLRFSFAPYAQNGDEYWIDDVSLLEVNTTTAVAPNGQSAAAPVRYGLQQNYPNPFNPTTQLTYALAAAAPVSLKVYDPLGRLVATLVEGEVEAAGVHRVQFNGAGLSSGAYFCRLTTPQSSQTVRMLLLR